MLRPLAVAAALVFVAPFAGRGLLAQAPAAVPIEQEQRHRLVFANEFVRIIDAMLPPLYVSQNHTHSLDNISVTILPGLQGSQGQARVGFAGFSRGGYSHVITNPNTAPMRFIAVELRAPDASGSGGEIAQPNHTTVLSNGRVRVWRVKLDAGQSIAGHTHQAGFVSIVVRGVEGAGTWKWHGGAEAVGVIAAGAQALEIRRGRTEVAERWGDGTGASTRPRPKPRPQSGSGAGYCCCCVLLSGLHAVGDPSPNLASRSAYSASVR